MDYSIRNSKINNGSDLVLYHKSHAEIVDTNDGYNVQAKINAYDSHVSNTSNPHSVTLTQLGYSESETFKRFINTLYPVGSIKLSYNKVNPGTYLPGTTWVLESQGRYLLGAYDGSTGPWTGGSWTVNIAHTHYIDNHNHGLTDHSHTINSHSHTVNNHVHETYGHTLTIAEIPSHAHGFWALQWNQLHSNCSANVGSDFGGAFKAETDYVGGGGSHSHGNTGGSQPGTSGVTLTTNGCGTLYTNGCGTLYTSSSMGDITIQPPYLGIFVWRRSA